MSDHESIDLGMWSAPGWDRVRAAALEVERKERERRGICRATALEFNGETMHCQLARGHVGSHDDGCVTWKRYQIARRAWPWLVRVAYVACSGAIGGWIAPSQWSWPLACVGAAAGMAIERRLRLRR